MQMSRLLIPTLFIFRRGKPLFLHGERYRLLESQWIGHKFDHTTRKWVMHRDAI